MVILLRFLPYLIGFGLLFAGWVWLDRSCWSTACVGKTEELRQVREEMSVARQRATDLALLYVKAGEEADAKARSDKLARDKDFAALAARKDRLRTAPDIRVSSDGRVLLDSASNLANSAPAPIGDKAPAVVVSGFSFSEAELVAAWAEAAMAYADAVAQWKAAVNFYEALRNSALQTP